MGQYYKPVSMEKKEHVYSHDYNNGLKLMEHSWIGNNFVRVVEELISKGGAWFGDRIVWAGDYADGEKKTITKKNPDGTNLYHSCKKQIKPVVKKTKKRNFLVNLDTNEFVDLRKVPESPDTNWKGFRIHPLPILTCDGNGRGGGDLRIAHELIGKWARNRVVMQTTQPKNSTEVIFNLTEQGVVNVPVLQQQ